MKVTWEQLTEAFEEELYSQISAPSWKIGADSYNDDIVSRYKEENFEDYDSELHQFVDDLLDSGDIYVRDSEYFWSDED